MMICTLDDRFDCPNRQFSTDYKSQICTLKESCQFKEPYTEPQQCPEILSQSGCEYVKCRYASRDKDGKPYCKDPNEYKNADGDYVCGRRDDAILVEPQPQEMPLLHSFNLRPHYEDKIEEYEDISNQQRDADMAWHNAQLELLDKKYKENFDAAVALYVKTEGAAIRAEAVKQFAEKSKLIWYILDEIACKHSATHIGSGNLPCPICDRAEEAMKLCPDKPNPEECQKLFDIRAMGGQGSK